MYCILSIENYCYIIRDWSTLRYTIGKSCILEGGHRPPSSTTIMCTQCVVRLLQVVNIGSFPVSRFFI